MGYRSDCFFPGGLSHMINDSVDTCQLVDIVQDSPDSSNDLYG